MPGKRGSIEERFRRFFSVGGEDECWNWTGYCQPSGHARFTDSKGSSKGAYRFAYEMSFGSIPSGMLIRHTCDNPKCVNPSHLALGTDADNMRDKVERGRPRHPGPLAALKAHNAKKRAATHCKRGHEFSEHNTRDNGKGGRACLACRKERYAERKVA